MPTVPHRPLGLAQAGEEAIPPTTLIRMGFNRLYVLWVRSVFEIGDDPESFEAQALMPMVIASAMDESRLPWAARNLSATQLGWWVKHLELWELLHPYLLEECKGLGITVAGPDPLLHRIGLAIAAEMQRRKESWANQRVREIPL